MAIKPQLPKKEQVRGIQRDLKAKKDPKGGAQKKEIGDANAAILSTRGNENRLQ